MNVRTPANVQDNSYATGLDDTAAERQQRKREGPTAYGYADLRKSVPGARVERKRAEDLGEKNYHWLRNSSGWFEGAMADIAPVIHPFKVDLG